MPGPARSAPSPRPRPTRRQLDVLRFLADGRTNRGIAVLLTISENTVEFHLAHLYAKLEVSSRTAAVHRARELGWIP